MDSIVEDASSSPIDSCDGVEVVGLGPRVEDRGAACRCMGVGAKAMVVERNNSDADDARTAVHILDRLMELIFEY